VCRKRNVEQRPQSQKLIEFEISKSFSVIVYGLLISDKSTLCLDIQNRQINVIGKSCIMLLREILLHNEGKI